MRTTVEVRDKASRRPWSRAALGLTLAGLLSHCGSDPASVSPPGAISLRVDSTIGVGHFDSATVSIPSNATGVVVTLTNDNPSAMGAPDTLTIDASLGARRFSAVGLALGTATLQATAPSFEASMPVTVRVGHPDLAIMGSTRGTVGSSAPFGVAIRGPDGNPGKVNSPLPVTFTVDDISVANFGGSAQTTVTVPSGQSDSQDDPAFLSFVGAGVVWTTATAAPEYPPEMVRTTVLPSQLVLQLQIPDSTIGVAQFDSGTVDLGFDADTAITVTFTNDNPSVVKTPTLTIYPPFDFGRFSVVGLAPGTATLQASAPRFTDSNPVTVEVGTPSLQINTSGGSVNTNTIVGVSSYDHTGEPGRVGSRLTVTLTVDDTSVANFAGRAEGTAAIWGGETSSVNEPAFLSLVSPGVVRISATAPDYEAAVDSITVLP